MPFIATTGIQIKLCGIQTRKKKWHCMNKKPFNFCAVFFLSMAWTSYHGYDHEVLSPGSTRQIYCMILDLLSFYLVNEVSSN